MVLIMGMIFYLSNQPGDLIPLPQIFGLDKAAHGIAYGLLACTFLYGFHQFAPQSKGAVIALAAVLFCLLFGIADEFHQSFIPGRTVSVWDVVADGVGGILVAGSWYKLTAADGL